MKKIKNTEREFSNGQMAVNTLVLGFKVTFFLIIREITRNWHILFIEWGSQSRRME
jgi:hypothetical protein